MGPDLVWLLYLKTFSAARHTLPESLLDPHPHTQPLHTPTFHFTCLLTIISHFFPLLRKFSAPLTLQEPPSVVCGGLPDSH